MPLLGQGRFQGIPDLPIVDVVALAEALQLLAEPLIKGLMVADQCQSGAMGQAEARQGLGQGVGQGGAIQPRLIVVTERLQQGDQGVTLRFVSGLDPVADQGVCLLLPLPEQGGGELAAEAGLELGARAEIHGGGEVQQQPVGLLLLFAIQPGVGAPEAGGDPPVDVAHLVPGLIEAQLTKIQARLSPEPSLTCLVDARPLTLSRPQPDGQQLGQGQGDIGMGAGISGSGHGRRSSGAWHRAGALSGTCNGIQQAGNQGVVVEVVRQGLIAGD